MEQQQDPHAGHNHPPIPPEKKPTRFDRALEFFNKYVVFVLYGIFLIDLLTERYLQAIIILLIINLTLVIDMKRLKIMFPPNIQVNMPPPQIFMNGLPMSSHPMHEPTDADIKKKAKKAD